MMRFGLLPVVKLLLPDPDHLVMGTINDVQAALDTFHTQWTLQQEGPR